VVWYDYTAYRELRGIESAARRVARNTMSSIEYPPTGAFQRRLGGAGGSVRYPFFWEIEIGSQERMGPIQWSAPEFGRSRFGVWTCFLRSPILSLLDRSGGWAFRCSLVLSLLGRSWGLGVSLFSCLESALEGSGHLLQFTCLYCPILRITSY
jgi:hypothetical protein